MAAWHKLCFPYLLLLLSSNYLSSLVGAFLFECNDGCMKPEEFLDDDFCDCDDCADEQSWTCESCGGCRVQGDDCSIVVSCLINSTTTTETPQTSGPQTTDGDFICDDGCVVNGSFVDDDYCDCSDCEDETDWSCATCYLPCFPCGSKALCTSFTCDNGCEITTFWMDDGICDCGDCEDETNWSCDTCGGCPEFCGVPPVTCTEPTNNPTTTRTRTTTSTTQQTIIEEETTQVTFTQMPTTMKPTTFVTTESTEEPSIKESTAVATESTIDNGKQGGGGSHGFGLWLWLAIAGASLATVLLCVAGVYVVFVRPKEKERVAESVSSFSPKTHPVEMQQIEMVAAFDEAKCEDLRGTATERVEGEEVAVVGTANGGLVTDAGDDSSEERREAKSALHKVDQIQRAEKDVDFGQMLGDLELGNALLEDDVVADIGAGETTRGKAVGGEAHVVFVAVEGAEGGGKFTAGPKDSDERRELKDALFKVGRMQRDERDAEFGVMLGSLKLGNDIMEEDVLDDIDGVPTTGVKGLSKVGQ